MKKNIVKGLVFVIIFFAILQIVNIVTMKKFAPEIAVDTSITRGFYEETNNSLQVLYIGSSHMFSSVSPLDIWAEYGVTGYVRASSNQRIWTSYYLLKDALLRQKPEVVVIEVLKLFDDSVIEESFNREVYDEMKWSTVKYEAISKAIEDNPAETMSSYLFPVIRYHDRWKELSCEDFSYLISNKRQYTKGFLPRLGIKSCVEDISLRYNVQEDSFADIPEECEKYLDKIVELCDMENIGLILLKTPTVYDWTVEKYNATKKYADSKGIVYLDFNVDIELMNAANIDWSIDTLDEGNHMNYTGARKISSVVGKFIVNNYELEDIRKDDEVSKQWDDDLEYYKKCLKEYKIK